MKKTISLLKFLHAMKKGQIKARVKIDQGEMIAQIGFPKLECIDKDDLLALCLASVSYDTDVLEVT